MALDYMSSKCNVLAAVCTLSHAYFIFHCFKTKVVWISGSLIVMFVPIGSTIVMFVSIDATGVILAHTYYLHMHL